MAVGDMDEQDTVDMCSAWGGIPAKNQKGENLLLFIGIIDILQSFGVTKKLEHTWKSIIHDGDTVSVHRPSFYALRFKKFLSERVFRKMPPNLKPALSFRRSQGHYKRTISRDVAEERPGRSSQAPPGAAEPAPPGGVTVITIGGQGDSGQEGQQQQSGILPAVLRDKPRVSTVAPPARPQQLVGSTSGRPDVADVVAVSCTPPPSEHGILSSPGMSGDERVQIYVPSPQSTPYSTISKHAADSHKSITFLSYQPDSLISGVSSTQSHQEESMTETTMVSHSYQEETNRTLSNSYQEESRVETAIMSSSSMGVEGLKEEDQRSMEQEEEQPLSLSE